MSLTNGEVKIEDDEDDCQLVCIAKLSQPVPASPPVPITRRPRKKNDSDDDVQLIKIERIRPPSLSESQLKLPPKVAKTFFKSPLPEPISDPLDVKKTFSCTQCTRIFASGQHLMNHVQVHIERSQKPVKIKKPPAPVIPDGYNCSYCSMSFDKQVSLAAHMNVHRDRVARKAVKCKECGENFHSNGSLWNHRKTVHKHILFKCSACCKTFATKAAYEDHMKRHEEQGAIMCDICGKSKFGFRKASVAIISTLAFFSAFTMQNTLKIHMRIHSGERPFLCSECGKSFSTNIRLQEHVRRHKGQRRHECPICNKQFYEKTELKKHSYIHSSDKVFSLNCLL